MHKAIVEIETGEPELIMKALQPDMTQSAKFEASLKAAGHKLLLTVESAELGDLIAGLSGSLRLIKTAKDTNEVD